MNDFFRMTGVTKSYWMGDEWSPVLKNIDLTIKEGEFLSVLGPSGSGKSTLMNILSGIYAPDAGSIIIDGKKAKIRNPQDAEKLRRDRLGFAQGIYRGMLRYFGLS